MGMRIGGCRTTESVRSTPLTTISRRNVGSSCGGMCDKLNHPAQVIPAAQTHRSSTLPDSNRDRRSVGSLDEAPHADCSPLGRPHQCLDFRHAFCYLVFYSLDDPYCIILVQIVRANFISLHHVTEHNKTPHSDWKNQFFPFSFVSPCEKVEKYTKNFF